MEKLITAQEVAAIFKKREKDSAEAVSFLEKNIPLFNNWACEARRVAEDRFNGMVKLSNEPAGIDLIVQTFKNAGWECTYEAKDTGNSQVDGIFDHKITVRFLLPEK